MQQRLIDAGAAGTLKPCALHVPAWTARLHNYTPSDPCYTSEVLTAGAQHGSYVRFEGDRSQASVTRNHPPVRQHTEATVQLIEQEVRLGHMLGPFDPKSPPLPNIRVSPLNIVETRTGWRL